MADCCVEWSRYESRYTYAKPDPEGMGEFCITRGELKSPRTLGASIWKCTHCSRIASIELRGVLDEAAAEEESDTDALEAALSAAHADSERLEEEKQRIADQAQDEGDRTYQADADAAREREAERRGDDGTLWGVDD